MCLRDRPEKWRMGLKKMDAASTPQSWKHAVERWLVLLPTSRGQLTSAEKIRRKLTHDFVYLKQARFSPARLHRAVV